MNTYELRQISRSLPEGFQFYSFGNVNRCESTRELSTEFEGKQGVSFRLFGDTQALLVLVFDQGLDVSMYSELGNILASRLCEKLSVSSEGDLMITPPLMLGSTQLSRLSRGDFPFVRQSYRHVDGDKIVPLEALILPIFSNGSTQEAGELGNA